MDCEHLIFGIGVPPSTLVTLTFLHGWLREKRCYSDASFPKRQLHAYFRTLDSL